MMRKRSFYGFMFIALIGFLLQIFLIFNIKDKVMFKSQLLILELLILFALIVGIVLFLARRSAPVWLGFFYLFFVINSLYLFIKRTSVTATLLLLVGILGGIIASRYKPARKQRKLAKKEREIETQVPHEEEPKIIIEKKKYVAGVTGKYYFEEGHPLTKRIKEKRHFSSKQEAEKSGYRKHKTVD